MIKILSLLISIIFTDQLLKYLLINGLMDSNYYKNFGAGLGLFKNQNSLIIVSMMLSFLLMLYLYKNINLIYSKLGIIFLLSGGLSNFIDRIRLDYIIDYINLYNLVYINIADVFIFVGFILILVNMFNDNFMKGYDKID